MPIVSVPHNSEPCCDLKVYSSVSVLCYHHTNTINMPSSSSSDFERLEQVSAKRQEWLEVPATKRVQLLEEVLAIVVDTGYEALSQEAGVAALTMMGIPTDTTEGRFEAEWALLIFISTAKSNLSALRHVIKIQAGEDAPSHTSKDLAAPLKTRTADNGQVCVTTFPLLPEDKQSQIADCIGEVWLDEERVQAESEVRHFQFEEFGREGGGLMVVLGAGNLGGLDVADILYNIFVKNCVVYLKLHPMRGYLEAVIRILFRPLIDRGYLEIEAHTTMERASALVYHPDVTGVHLTGGKATHDAIVWGSPTETNLFGKSEQERNIENKTPKLKANMTSELGAVSPWIVVPYRYTETELKDQAGQLAYWMHSNASCMCNSPKVIVISDDWEQKDQFLQIVETSLRNTFLPVAYYPRTKERWQSYRDKYPDAKEVDSSTGMGVAERKLTAPQGSSEATLLPWLIVDLAIDATSESGRKAAQKEYAFSKEPFCPMYTIARLQNITNDDLEGFCTTAASFCNDCLYGSLSGTVTVAPSLIKSQEVQGLIANLRFGSLGVNLWGGSCYAAMTGGWGAFPGETLENVQSGRGRINNLLCLSNFQKFVLTSPICSPSHIRLNPDLVRQAKFYKAYNKLIIAPGFGTTIGFLSQVTGVNLVQVSVVAVAALAVGVGYFFLR
jgi:hypothetical protein